MIDIAIFFTLLIIGYIFGQLAEKRYFASITDRENALSYILTFSEKLPPPGNVHSDVFLVGGNVVVSIDFFKHITAGLKNIFGGRIGVYESLVERARREAILRMKEDADKQSAKMIINVKLETSSISKGQHQNSIGSVEVYAYGTALKPSQSAT